MVSLNPNINTADFVPHPPPRQPHRLDEREAAYGHDCLGFLGCILSGSSTDSHPVLVVLKYTYSETAQEGMSLMHPVNHRLIRRHSKNS